MSAKVTPITLAPKDRRVQAALLIGHIRHWTGRGHDETLIDALLQWQEKYAIAVLKKVENQLAQKTSDYSIGEYYEAIEDAIRDINEEINDLKKGDES